MITTFENAKVGDKVWDFIYGWGVVVDTQALPDDFSHTLLIEFCRQRVYYATTGTTSSSSVRTLFWDEIKFETPAQPPRMKLVHDYDTYLTNSGMCYHHTEKRKQAAMLGIKE